MSTAPAPGGRPVIVHYHVFKNAGSTVDFILRRNFGDRFLSFDGPEPWSVIPSDEVLRLLLDRPELSAVSSHQARFPVPRHATLQVHPILFLRHPLDRIGSVYRFERAQVEDNPGSRQAKARGFADYVRWRLEGPFRIVVQDFHTLYLSDAQIGLADPRAARAEPRHLEQATRVLASHVFGLVERFEDSMVLFDDALRGPFPRLDLAWAPQNVSAGRKDDLEERLDDLRHELGAELYARCVEANRLDLELYTFAERLFEERLRRIEDLGRRRSRLRERAQRLLTTTVDPT